MKNFVKKRQAFRPQRGTVFLALLLVIVFLEAGVLIFTKPASSTGSASIVRMASLQEHADAILEKCALSGYRPACYDIEIPKLMDAFSMEETFEVTSMIQEKDQGYWYCHVLGHDLSAKETAKDPGNWKGVIARCPSGMCSNGCIHGAFQERFRTDALPDAELSELKPELQGICERRDDWNPTSLEQATCVHALGHLTMYITDANIDKSTKLCEEIVSNIDGNNLSQLCFDGAFMQIFQPLEPEDFALVEGKQPSKEELISFCGQFSGKKRSSCLSEGWPLFYEEVVTPEGLVRFCSVLEEDPVQYKRCYEALFYVLAAQFKFDEEKIKNFCMGLPQERKGQCFANAASRMIETDARLIDKSSELCYFAESIGEGKRCYEELLLYSTYNFHAGSEEFLSLCSKLPEPWRNKCLSNI